jgi:hypothetical protein
VPVLCAGLTTDHPAYVDAMVAIADLHKELGQQDQADKCAPSSTKCDSFPCVFNPCSLMSSASRTRQTRAAYLLPTAFIFPGWAQLGTC